MISFFTECETDQVPVALLPPPLHQVHPVFVSRHMTLPQWRGSNLQGRRIQAR